MSFLAFNFANVDQIGMTMRSKDGIDFVSAGSHPIVLVWDVVAVVLFVVLMIRGGNRTVIASAGRGRRIGSFLIDFWFSLLTLSGIGALVPLWLEAVRTGHFVWQFQRDYSVSADKTVGPSVLIFMLLMILYFAFPLTRGRQTVGCFIMGIKTTPPFGDAGSFTFRAALKRTFYEFRGITSILKWRWDIDGEGRTWYDIETNCTVVLIEDD